jgi:uncharacterized protein (DUF2147 family)
MLGNVNSLIKLCVTSLFLVIFSSVATAATAATTNSVEGYWQTIDGKTKKPSSIIEIQKNGAIVNGKVVKTYSPGSQKSLCVACQGVQKNKPILGLTIIKGMQCTANTCEHGTILDPRDGKVYHATMKLVNNGQTLKVRGYIGMPLLGKTVIWQRVSHL